MINKMLYYFSITGLINAIASSSIGVFVYLKNKKSIINKTFALFAIYVALWSYAYIFWPLAKTKTDCLFWFRMLHIGAILIPIGFYHFVYSFLGKNKKYTLIFAYFFAAFFLLFSFSKYYIPDMKPMLYIPYYGMPGILYPYFLFMFFSYAFYSIFLLFKEYRTTVDLKRKNQILNIAIGTLIGFIGGGTNYLLWYDIPIPPYLNPLVTVYVVLVAYAIVRHQLMEIEVIIKKTLVFAGLFAAAFAVFVLPTLIIQEFIVGQMGLGGRITGLSISAILIILILKPLENFLISITDKFLFQKKYDYKELLKTFTTEVLTVLDKNVLVHTTVDRLSNIMKIQSCGVLLFDKIKDQYELVASVGVDKDWRNIKLGLDNTLATFLSRTKSYLSTKHQGKDSPIPKRILDDMNKLKLELAIPLVIHDDMIGILTLGKKKSDEDYTQDDMGIILPLARTLAIAISNAQVLDELGKTQAEAAQREKMAVIGTLSAGINHEICNPLGIARGQCEAFLLNIKDGLYKNKSEKELLEKAINIMEKVIHETDRATAITKRLSTFAKPSKGLLTDVMSIKDEIDEVLALIGYEMKLEKIEVENKVPKDLPPIIGDKKQLEEVFFNLIRNAAQAIQDKGKITISAYEDMGRVHVNIQDTGHGISDDQMGQIFNPFYTTKEPGKGTGLGLFIVRQVVERNRGRISLKSKVGEGTVFILEFPVAEKARVG